MLDPFLGLELCINPSGSGSCCALEIRFHNTAKDGTYQQRQQDLHQPFSRRHLDAQSGFALGAHRSVWKEETGIDGRTETVALARARFDRNETVLLFVSLHHPWSTCVVWASRESNFNRR